jgi:hypothetical protein
MQRLAVEYTTQATSTVVNLSSEDVKGRIIGREGRNIRAFEQLTGTDLIIDETPEAVVISSFDPVRREIARLTLMNLMLDGRIHPARIEEVYGNAQNEVDLAIKEAGEDAAIRAGVPGPPRAGIAGVRYAATIAASRAVAGEPVLVPPGDEAAFLAPLPSGLLTRDPDVRARLTRFGLHRIGAVAELPRSALVARFGEEGAWLHARARGEELERFRPRRAPERLALGLPIDPPLADLEPLRFVLRRLAGALADQLVARGMAADRVRVGVALVSVTRIEPERPDTTGSQAG